MTDKKDTVLVLAGPTASGKTALAIKLARAFDAEIFSADARQFYREMQIGTAKPTEEELAEAKQHFINSLSIEQDYSVGDYECDALAALAEYFERKPGRPALLVGGSGLFLRAVCEGLDRFPPVPAHLREELQELPLAELQKQLAELDPLYYQEVDKHNRQRVIRALEVCISTQAPYSSFRSGASAARPFRCLKYALDWPREQLYARINQRVEQMREQGLEAEARALYPYSNYNALQTVGYKELFAHFEGQCSLDEAFARIAQHSRNYAKRQITWFRKEKDMQFVAAEHAFEQLARALES